MDHSRVKYVVDEANRVVVAEIEGVDLDAQAKLNNKIIPVVSSKLKVHSISKGSWDPWGDSVTDEFIMPYKLRAVARCHPEDTWDIEKGKQIALKKLDEKYEAAINKRINNFANVLSSAVLAIDEYLENKNF